MKDQYTIQTFLSIITVKDIQESIFDMDEYLDDLESDIERQLNSSDFFPCMHFECLSDYDWDDEEEVLIAGETIILLITLQWEEETLPEDKTKTPYKLLKQAFNFHLATEKEPGYFDFFILHNLNISHKALERIKEGWV